MGAWIERQYNWAGLASRHEYRRWLPPILAADVLLLWVQFRFGTAGYVDIGQFGWIGASLFLIGLAYYIGWFCLTARRLRSAGISRAWLLFALLTISLPVGGYHINSTLIAAFLLTVVAALAPDDDPYSAT